MERKTLFHAYNESQKEIALKYYGIIVPINMVLDIETGLINSVGYFDMHSFKEYINK